jgi:hemoglobin
MRWPALAALLLGTVIAMGGLNSRSATADDSLYRNLGERATIARIVDGAFDRWLADERIKETFDNVNIDRFKGRLTDQLCELAGGPCHYKGRNMYLTHKGLHLDTAQFNAQVEGLQAAMEKLGIPFRTQNKLIALLAPMKRDIVTR